MGSADTVIFRSLMGIGPSYETTASKASFTRLVEQGYWAAWMALAIGVSVWLAPYWGMRILLVGLGFYFCIAGALVEKMDAGQNGTAKNLFWRVAAYGGLLFSLFAIAYNHWQTREEFLYWKYKWTDQSQLASVRFDFANPPKLFNEPAAQQMYPGKPIRCMQFFPQEAQYSVGTHECYFWTDSFNDLPGKMSEFLFTKDRLTAVRIEFPLWQTSSHHRALVERYGSPAGDAQEVLSILGAARLTGIGLLAFSQSNQLSVWTLPAGVLMTDSSIAWKEPYGMMFWLEKDWFCANRNEGTDTPLKADKYCKQ